MYSEESIYGVIEQYIEGSLSTQERNLLEEQMKIDASFKQKVLACESAKSLILQNRLKDVKSLMSEEKNKIDKVDTFKKVGIISLTSLLVVIGAFKYTNTDKGAIKEQPNDGIKQSEKTIPSVQIAPVLEDKTIKTKSITLQKKAAKEPIASQKDLPISQEGKHQDSGTLKSASSIHIAETKTIETHKADKVPNIEIVPKDICEGIKISGEITTHEPCFGSHDGWIELRNISGGRAPYRSILNGKDLGLEHTFKNLYPGSYKIELQDFNACKQIFNTVILAGKDCVTNYDFNPSHGGEWLGPILEQPAKLTILEKTGKLVYTKQLGVGERCTWSGYNQTGQLRSGYFVFILENEDGTVNKGTITITE